jgi:Cu+-exporting ATPase
MEGHFGGIGEIARDPVCGMVLEKQSASARFEHQRRVYYFCSAECQALFKGNPDRYAEGAGHDTTGHGGRRT